MAPPRTRRVAQVFRGERMENIPRTVRDSLSPAAMPVKRGAVAGPLAFDVAGRFLP
jgi:hypothetical protein